MLSQIPTASPSEIGAWLVALAAVGALIVLVLTGLNQWRQFTTPSAKPRRPADERFVTKADLKALGDKVEKHEKYTHERFHDFANSLNTVTLKLEGQPNAMRSMIDASIAPLLNKIDRMALQLATMAAKWCPPSEMNTDSVSELP